MVVDSPQERTPEQWRSLAASTAWNDRATAATEWDDLSISISRKLARDPDVRVRLALATRVKPLASSVIADLASSPSHEIREALAGGVQPFTEAQCHSAMHDVSRQVRLAFASSGRALPQQWCDLLAAHTDPEIRIRFIGSCRQMTAERQMMLAQSELPVERLALAYAHGSAGLLADEAILVLAMDPARTIREAAEKAMSVDLLVHASEHDSDAVRQAASDFVIRLAASGF